MNKLFKKALIHILSIVIMVSCVLSFSVIKVEAKDAEAKIVAISAGGFFSVVLKDDGTVWNWGGNYDSQLGDNTNIDRCEPVKVSGLNGVTAISAGITHTLALKDDGTVWSWGGNYSGQLGNGTKENSNIPIQVSGLSDVKAIAAGNKFSVALKNDGTVWSWGDNCYVGTGDGSSWVQCNPVEIYGFSDIIAIAAGGDHTIALKNDGTVWSWGNNSGGQLGDGTTTNKVGAVQVNGLSGITAIAAGVRNSIALRNDGTVWYWGYDFYTGLENTSYVPVQVQGLNEVSNIYAKEFITIFLKEDGSVWKGGWGARLELEDDIKDDRKLDGSTPKKINGLEGITDLSVSLDHGLALKNDGTLLAWGDNLYGQLGNGNKNQIEGVVTVIEGQKATNDIDETNTKIKEMTETIKKLPTTAISMFKGWSLEMKGLAFSISGFFVVAILLIIKKLKNLK